MFLYLTLLAILSVANGYHDPDYNTYDRIVVAAKNVYNYTTASGRVIDPFCVNSRNFLGHSTADCLEQRERVNEHLIARFGIDVLGTGTYNATTDTWALPYGVLISYSNGNDLRYRLIYDSWNYKVEKKNAHIAYLWGYLFQFTTSGVFPGGVMAGRPFSAGQIVGRTKLLWLDLRKQADWNNPDECDWTCRDTNDAKSLFPAIAVANSFGLSNNYDAVDIKNTRTGYVGYLSSHAVPEILLPSSVTVQHTRNIVTLNKDEPNMVIRLPY